MGVKFFGDWDGVKNLHNRLQTNERPMRESMSEHAATLYLAALHKIIDSNGEGLDWKISTSWANKKLQDKYHSSQIYIDSGKFASKLKKVKLSDGTWFAGASADDQYDENLTMEQLAFYREHGVGNTEANPLFAPAKQMIMDPVKKKALEEITKTVKGGR